MTLLVPNVGEVDMLGMFVNKTTQENLILKLYSNDKTPAEADVAGDYTETDFTGYAAITLTGASWVITPGAPSTASYAKQTFTSSAAQTKNCYGYFLVGATSGVLKFAERFASPPYAMTNIGDKIDVTLNLTLE